MTGLVKAKCECLVFRMESNHRNWTYALPNKNSIMGKLCMFKLFYSFANHCIMHAFEGRFFLSFVSFCCIAE